MTTIAPTQTPQQPTAQTGDVPAQDAFQSRPFAEQPLQPEHDRPDLATQLATAQPVGHHFGNIPVFPSTPPITHDALGDQAAEAMEDATPTDHDTGLPAPLKAELEATSGYALDDVTVHYNSPKPARLDMRAYAQGTHQGAEIHLGPGQEELLKDEATHVLHLKEGLPQANLMMKGQPVCYDQELERQAHGTAAVPSTGSMDGWQPLPAGAEPYSPIAVNGSSGIILPAWRTTTHPGAIYEWDSLIKGRRWYRTKDGLFFFEQPQTTRDKQYYGFAERQTAAHWYSDVTGYDTAMDTIANASIPAVDELIAQGPQVDFEWDDPDLKQEWGFYYEEEQYETVNMPTSSKAKEPARADWNPPPAHWNPPHTVPASGQYEEQFETFFIEEPIAQAPHQTSASVQDPDLSEDKEEKEEKIESLLLSQAEEEEEEKEEKIELSSKTTKIIRAFVTYSAHFSTNDDIAGTYAEFDPDTHLRPIDPVGDYANDALWNDTLQGIPTPKKGMTAKDVGNKAGKIWDETEHFHQSPEANFGTTINLLIGEFGAPAVFDALGSLHEAVSNISIMENLHLLNENPYEMSKEDLLKLKEEYHKIGGLGKGTAELAVFIDALANSQLQDIAPVLAAIQGVRRARQAYKAHKLSNKTMSASYGMPHQVKRMARTVSMRSDRRKTMATAGTAMAATALLSVIFPGLGVVAVGGGLLLGAKMAVHSVRKRSQSVTNLNKLGYESGTFGLFFNKTKLGAKVDQHLDEMGYPSNPMLRAKKNPVRRKRYYAEHILNLAFQPIQRQENDVWTTQRKQEIKAAQELLDLWVSKDMHFILDKMKQGEDVGSLREELIKKLESKLRTNA